MPASLGYLVCAAAHRRNRVSKRTQPSQRAHRFEVLDPWPLCRRAAGYPAGVSGSDFGRITYRVRGQPAAQRVGAAGYLAVPAPRRRPAGRVRPLTPWLVPSNLPPGFLEGTRQHLAASVCWRPCLPISCALDGARSRWNSSRSADSFLARMSTPLGFQAAYSGSAKLRGHVAAGPSSRPDMLLVATDAASARMANGIEEPAVR